MASCSKVPNKGKESTSLSASVILGSEEYFNVICQPCANSDIRKKAEVFCTICKECLCQDCHVFHKRLTATMKHGLLDLCCNPCANGDVHEEGDVFCKNCQEFLCRSCQTFHGRLTATRSHEVVSVINFVKQNRPKEKEPLRGRHVVTNAMQNPTSTLSRQIPTPPNTQQVRPSIATTLTDRSVATRKKSPSFETAETVQSPAIATQPGGIHRISVPIGIVKELERLPGGINSIKDDLKQNHLIDAEYEGKLLHLIGPNDTVLDIAIEFLHVKVGRAKATYKTLGGKGTVAWTYRGKHVKHIQYLFPAELKKLSTVKSTKTAQPKGDSLVISCSYADYQTVNDMLENLDKKIKNCKQKTVKVDVKDQQLAKKFEKEQNGHAFYCCLIFDNKDKSKVELEFYGREEKDYQEGISMWETIKQGDKKKPASSSTSTRNLKGNESMKDSSILEEQKTTGQQKFTNSYQTTATASLLEKHATNTKTSETDETAPVSVQKTMDVDWDETANATSSSSTYSTNLSKPQMNVSSTASASDGPEENIYSRAATTEVKKTPGRTIGSGETAKYSFQIENMLVYVYKESITEIKGMDAITNAANERLMHVGGVAYYISKAAGKKMEQDCYSYIARKGPLQVTRNYVSIPGDIKCKGIIHAVGPTWYDYTDKKENCARDLYKTIKNIFITANNKKWQKVALSAISSGIFGVPKKLCAEMYIKAFADYATEADGTLKEVHFIDLNREILDIVIETHKTWMIDASKLDFRNALEYVPAWEKKQIRRGGLLS